MNSKALFDKLSIINSRKVTRAYSTSFSLGIFLLGKEIRDAIYSIYGFVRFADEIVDTFHDFDKKKLLENFERDTYEAIRDGISLNPVLNAFQYAVNTYKVDLNLIDSFLTSMRMDLEDRVYEEKDYQKYIYGSAEVVGLMCLKVFCLGDEKQYEFLKEPALRLGAAFQKVNFLRDLQADYHTLGRTYFPNVNFVHFNDLSKREIEDEIENDFQLALEGIKKLPMNSRLGVYVAYVYYVKLLDKIKNTPPQKVMQVRIRVPNYLKIWLLFKSSYRYYTNLF